ncbi:MAG TPA: bifunctional helix-turn-helix transcriptional regulator/GNAT family N-acetyltransferase [Streptosporangiaceae bacterium]|nr:bifunctional helix-turn-helix transcriptional regulator/GNAT family N-acetyltransferase [Streptosporangiaceae bacterium]
MATTEAAVRRAAIDDPVAAVRAFNRLYTNVIGVLRGSYLGSPYSLTEARLLFELSQQDSTEVSALRRGLDIDAGYLSRILSRFEATGLITRNKSGADARRQVITLTAAGRELQQSLDGRAIKQIGALLGSLGEDAQQRLLSGIRDITEVLAGAPAPRSFLLRAPRPGDLGWVVQRQAAGYVAEYGWDDTYEAMVARIVADYVDHRDPAREAAWIAEADGERVGSIICVRKSDTVAKLRLLYVDPAARGLGIGSKLVEECLRFARAAGYTGITLWTNSVLAEARRIYERTGFTLQDEEPHHSFGADLIGQNWSRPL